MSKAWGYKDLEDYYRTSACVHRIPGIKIPSLFLNALDDPIVSKETIPYSVLESNPNCALGTTEYGGHLGYQTNFLSSNQWYLNPIFEFLCAYKE